MEKPMVIDVILPVPVGDLFSYSVPSEGTDLTGFRVVVPFGNRKHVTGIVAGINPGYNGDFVLKEVTEILDVKPLVTSRDIAFWRWLAEYYMCGLGEVMQAALPGGLMVESSSTLTINSEFVAKELFTGHVARIFEWLSANKKGEIKHIERSLGIKNTFSAIKFLIDQEAVFVAEQLKTSYQAKTEVFVSVSPLFKDDEVLNAFFSSLKRAPRQEEVLTNYYRLSEDESDPFVLRKQLITGGNYGAFKTLVKKGVLVEHEVEVSRLEESIPVVEAHQLTPAQSEANKAITQAFKCHNVVLLKGASASGKTEIYIHQIQDCIEQGKKVLFLVPEIALTTQLSKRLKRVFGSRMAIFHSKYNANKRTELWKTIAEAEGVQLVLGARSAIFMPFSNLGLVVIDEEHERSLKQHDPQPRYHARDAAIMLAGMHKARVLLGSATPSAESWYNVQCGKYGFVELTERYGQSQQPDVQIIDMNAAYRMRKLSYHFSFELIDEMRITLEKKKQIILFQNRRGYAPLVECKQCGWVQKCRQCDVSMTWHFDKHLMGCHYCGSTRQVITICPSCGSEALMNKGFGTEMVESELTKLFPEASVQRFDTDTTQGLKKMERIITAFEEGQIDIMVGTQMISRGLDFENVALVGILNADNLFNFPEFRASERAYQIITQVSGRAGRRKEKGMVVIQTHNPEHPVIKAVIQKEPLTLLDNELAERKDFKYPPFNRIVDVMMRHSNKDVLHRCAMAYSNGLKDQLGIRVLGPEVPGISRIKGMYQERILVKTEHLPEFKQIKVVLLDVMNQKIKTKEIPQTIKFSFDVDPQ